MRDQIQIRVSRPGDEAAILSCYNQIFPTGDGRIPPRTMEHWLWKFRANPTGLLHHVVAEHETEGIIGGYAGIPVRIWSEGQEQLAAQGVDLMVLPKWRRHGQRPGLFVHLGWKYHELWCGSEPGKVLFTYGWPVPAWRMGQRYLGYVNIRDWDFTFREIAPDSAPRQRSSDLTVQPVERFAADVDGLYAGLQPGFGLTLIRDARYLNWRYADRPDRTYTLLECRERSTDRLRGIAVHTKADFLRPGTGFLVDWLAHADDEDTTVALLGAVEDIVRVDGSGVLAAVWNHADARFLQMQRLGCMVMGTPYFLVLASFKYDTIYYRDNWYFTMGDSDLI